jgi:hypothetical protein
MGRPGGGGLCRAASGGGERGREFRWGLDVEGCVPDAHGQFFRDAAKTAAVPMLWWYADQDPYDSASAIRRYRAALEEARGRGPFYLFAEIGENGHYLASKPLIWRAALGTYLQALGLLTGPQGEP